MVHRLALLVGGVGAAAVLALALGVGGLFAPVTTVADSAQLTNPAPQAPVTAHDTTKTVIDKVYVEPTPKPAVVHINKPPRHPTAAVTVRQPTQDGEHYRGERDGGDRGDRGESGHD